MAAPRETRQIVRIFPPRRICAKFRLGVLNEFLTVAKNAQASVVSGGQPAVRSKSQPDDSGRECEQVCEITKHRRTLTRAVDFNHGDADAGSMSAHAPGNNLPQIRIKKMRRLNFSAWAFSVRPRGQHKSPAILPAGLNGIHRPSRSVVSDTHPDLPCADVLPAETGR